MYKAVFHTSAVAPFAALRAPGQVAALLEERLNQGVNFLLSGEIDHWKKDYKFGFGLNVGE